MTNVIYLQPNDRVVCVRKRRTSKELHLSQPTGGLNDISESNKKEYLFVCLRQYRNMANMSNAAGNGVK